ncbi:phosphatidylinositol-specific phospholipase C [Bacillus thuringiensis]|uniref:1-phosphatidylinositol phosphodiesterase n=1 Tax=Bacillus thuringiensis subsp. higo TaxID=132266 RepID=A0A9X6QQD0_BACUH|nr:phosphatidylinositol-specific phospholipase C [Bacillus thuringiensis]OUB49898.1 hypothetical protein BK716_16020 [Bacillus thuringiensis serovar higo]
MINSGNYVESCNQNHTSYAAITTFDLNGTSDRSGVSFDSHISIRDNNPRWMANLNDSFRISELSIPGTHGSMARFPLNLSSTNNLAVNQTMDLRTQLQAGIRYLDIRCRHVNNSFPIHHGAIFQNAVFDHNVLDPIQTFLHNNPSETILMRVQQEYTPQNNTRSFEATFAEYHSRYKGLFWNPTNNNPRLGEVRGRIILLQQFGGPLFGINYGSLDIQDRWNLNLPPSNISLSPDITYNKWIYIRNHFNRAMNDHSRLRIHLNHLSASPGRLSITNPSWFPYPWFVASGYASRSNNSASQVASNINTQQWPDYIRERSLTNIRVLFGGTNNLTTRRIRDGRITHAGIIAADFPGPGLIQGTIALNNQLRQMHSNTMYDDQAYNQDQSYEYERGYISNYNQNMGNTYQPSYDNYHQNSTGMYDDTYYQNNSDTHDSGYNNNQNTNYNYNQAYNTYDQNMENTYDQSYENYNPETNNYNQSPNDMYPQEYTNDYNQNSGCTCNQGYNNNYPK